MKCKKSNRKLIMTGLFKSKKSMTNSENQIMLSDKRIYVKVKNKLMAARGQQTKKEKTNHQIGTGHAHAHCEGHKNTKNAKSPRKILKQLRTQNFEKTPVQNNEERKNE